MEDEDFQQLLLDYAATANLPKNNGDWDVIDAKFPELEKYDRDVLHSYVLTYNQANQPDNMEDLGVINAKFPELFPVKKKKTRHRSHLPYLLRMGRKLLRSHRPYRTLHPSTRVLPSH